MLYTINYKWKEFNINLEKISLEIKKLTSNYDGMSCNKVMQIHFTEEPSEEIKIAIQTYWDSLTAESIEATSYKSIEDIKSQIDLLKADITTKTYDQLSMIQKKILLGVKYETNELFV